MHSALIAALTACLAVIKLSFLAFELLRLLVLAFSEAVIAKSTSTIDMIWGSEVIRNYAVKRGTQDRALWLVD